MIRSAAAQVAYRARYPDRVKEQQDRYNADERTKEKRRGYRRAAALASAKAVLGSVGATPDPADVWVCVSCGAIPAERLFCTPLCALTAEIVRYRRRIMRDGRIDDPEVQAALEIREAQVLWGHVYKRTLTPARRDEVFAAKGNRCLECGAPATEIDHIVSNYFGDESLDNLRPLCHECHLAKTLASPMPWDTTSPEARALHASQLADYTNRWQAPKPLRACDDEVLWQKVGRAMWTVRAAARLAEVPRSKAKAAS